MLDTNIVIHATESHSRVLEKLVEHDGSPLISAICLVELNRGIYRDPSPSAARQARLQLLTKCIPIVPFDMQAADRYDRILKACGWNRTRDFDRMATRKLPALVTDNLADFRDIPSLAVENWTA
jgi:tRNA(fMet)-specific endonuclease VapC